MGLSGSTTGQKIVIFFNALVRFAALIIGAATIGMYAKQKGFWEDHGLPAKISYEFAVGSFAIITSIALGIIPFILSYRPVALAAPWDFIMFLMYSAAFGLMKAIFYHSYDNHDKKFSFNSNDTSDQNFYNHWHDMMNNTWINLAGMIIFLISAVMGCILFFVGRKTAGSKASYV